jgi:hypothetical protein
VRALALTLVLTLLPAVAQSQTPAKVPSVGILMSVSAAGLAHDGWVPGRTTRS